jgi:hypothetical protein
MDAIQLCRAPFPAIPEKTERLRLVHLQKHSLSLIVRQAS